jgi:hypothetical protein
MIEHIIGFGLSVFIIFMGLAVVRVGLLGQHVDRFRLVSYAKNDNEPPKLHHRYITVGLGFIALLLGTALFGLELFLTSKMK